jgi:carbonic anhydrase
VSGESEEAGKEFYNGHTFEVEDLPGAPTIVIDGITYSLVQFHTHTPSEHTGLCVCVCVCVYIHPSIHK